MSFSRAEMRKLRQLLAATSITPQAPAPKKKKRRRRRKAAGGVPAGVSRGVNPSGVTPNNGEIVVSRCELLASISANPTSGTVDMVPTSSAMPWLHKLSSAFDRIEWITATLHWKPFVGTTTGGSVAFGVDWNSNTGSTPTRAQVQASTPVYESPVWQSGSINLPKRYLMTRAVYLLEASSKCDKMPGTFIWAVAGAASSNSALGEVWITYKVRLSGTTA